MPDDMEGKVKLAVLEEQIKGLREQSKQHANDTRERFESMDEKIDTLLEALNKGKGAFAFAMILSGMIGGVVAKGIAAVWGKIQ